MPDVYLHLDAKAAQTIERLKKRYHRNNYAEVFQLAMQLLDFANDMELDNGKLVVIKNGKEHEIRI
jgi:hypothetical protein